MVVATVVGAIAAAYLFFSGVAKAVLPFIGIATPETIRILEAKAGEVDVGGFRHAPAKRQCPVYDEPCTTEICEGAKENLVRYFSVVGLLERFEESLALMKLRFGWTLKNYSSFNVTRTRPNKRDLPKSTLDLIAERNRFDIELYECAANFFREAITKNAGEVSRILSGARSGANPGPLELGGFFDLFDRRKRSTELIRRCSELSDSLARSLRQ